MTIQNLKLFSEGKAFQGAHRRRGSMVRAKSDAAPRYEQNFLAGKITASTWKALPERLLLPKHFFCSEMIWNYLAVFDVHYLIAVIGNGRVMGNNNNSFLLIPVQIN